MGNQHFHGDMNFYGPFDQNWLKNGGARQIRDALSRLAREGK